MVSLQDHATAQTHHEAELICVACMHTNTRQKHVSSAAALLVVGFYRPYVNLCLAFVACHTAHGKLCMASCAGRHADIYSYAQPSTATVFPSRAGKYQEHRSATRSHTGVLTTWCLCALAGCLLTSLKLVYVRAAACQLPLPQ
jgi:hypothetical protein